MRETIAMTCAENLAAFVCRSGYEDLSDTAREQLKVRILDSLGCALGAFVRYLDFNDAYLATAETHHPSDNLTAILAATECGDVSSRELMTALAVAYEVQWRLSDVAPVRDKGLITPRKAFTPSHPEFPKSWVSTRFVPPMPLQSVALRLTRSGSPGPDSFRIGRVLHSRTRPRARTHRQRGSTRASISSWCKSQRDGCIPY